MTARIVAIVQARFRSTRLPGKILLDLAGKTVLERCVGRVRAITGVHEVVIATSVEPADDVIAATAGRLGVRCSRGSELDVLSRYAQAARETAADVVIRITSDCPLLDPDESQRVVAAFLDERPAYASNTLSRRLPRGLDTEVVDVAALNAANGHGVGDEREHVTKYIYAHPERFRCLSVYPPKGASDLSAHRWTLDTPEDYRFLFEIFAGLGAAADQARTADILRFLERRPELLSINSSVRQKA